MMKQCPNCGNTYADDHAFCTTCGAALVAAAPPPPPPPAPDEPTIQIPPSRQPAPAPPAHSSAGNAAPAKKPNLPMALVIVLAVCTVLAAACAGFIGYKAFQLKKSYETEQMLRLEAEQSASDIQAQLDKLQLDYDRQSDQLKDTSQRLDDAHSQQNDASGQLADVSSRLERAEADLAELTAMLDEGYGFASPQYYASKGVVVVGQHSSETITIYEDYSEENTYTYHTPNSGVSCTWNGSFSNGSTTLTITGNTPGYYSVSFTNDLNSDSFEVLVIVTE